jgi:hypothetical protein
MKVINTYLVYDAMNQPQFLYECEGGVWAISGNGTFGQTSTRFSIVMPHIAKKMVNETKSLYNKSLGGE